MLVGIKSIASIMPRLSDWIPEHKTTGADIESSSLLGPFFSLSPLAPEIARGLFANVEIQSEKPVTPTPIQREARQYHRYLYNICRTIIKSGKHGARGMLDWFSTALSWNKQRRVSEVDPTMVASDGFMYNLVSVLNIFAVPLLSPETHTKVPVLFRPF